MTLADPPLSMEFSIIDFFLTLLNKHNINFVWILTEVEVVSMKTFLPKLSSYWHHSSRTQDQCHTSILHPVHPWPLCQARRSSRCDDQSSWQPMLAMSLLGTQALNWQNYPKLTNNKSQTWKNNTFISTLAAKASRAGVATWLNKSSVRPSVTTNITFPAFIKFTKWVTIKICRKPSILFIRKLKSI